MTGETVDDAPQADHLLRVWHEPGSTADGGIVVHAAGEIDLTTAPKLREALDDVAATGRVVVDLTGVTFLGSVGLSVLVEHHQRRQEAGGSLYVAAGNRVVARAIAMTGLSDTLTMFDTLDEAVSATS